jgi:hypothetical protein
VHCDVAETATVEGVQTAETEVMVGNTGGGSLPVDPPPQAVTAIRTKQNARVWTRFFIKHSAFELPLL